MSLDQVMAAPDGGKRWMIQLWQGMTEGTLWAIPRSETIFQRQGDKLVFIEGSLSEYMACREWFATIGVEVTAGPAKGRT